MNNSIIDPTDIIISGDLSITFNINNSELLNKMSKDERWGFSGIFDDKISYKTYDVSAIREFLKEQRSG